MNIFRATILLLIFSISLLTGCGGDDDDGPTGSTDPELYDVTVSVTPSGSGTISPSADSSYEKGTTVQLEATASEEYAFVEWTGDVKQTDSLLSLTVDQNYSLTANFELKSYNLTTNTEGEGTVTEQVVPQKDYEHGTVVELTAEPAEGYGFVEWTGDIEDTENPAQLAIDGPKEVTAVFDPFYRAENGITIRCTEAEVGETGMVDGVAYTRRTVSQVTPSNAATTCTSGITDMSGLFDGITDFNEDISHWDVGSVTDMGSMFRDATSFNQDIAGWDVSGVENMTYMFWGATDFNGNISSWNVGSVIYMTYMFRDASSFNGDIGSWDVSSVSGMPGMFWGASSFGQDISSWCVENISSEPTDFATGSSLAESQKPLWGTCPE